MRIVVQLPSGCGVEELPSEMELGVPFRIKREEKKDEEVFVLRKSPPMSMAVFEEGSVEKVAEYYTVAKLSG